MMTFIPLLATINAIFFVVFALICLVIYKSNKNENDDFGF